MIGAPFGQDPDGGVGGLYVFTRTGSVWTERQKLLGDRTKDTAFGWSVSLSADTAVVGTRPGSTLCSAYVFVRDEGTWTQQQELMPSDDEIVDAFGWSVSVSGDIAVIGAPYATVDGRASGSVYVFVRIGTTWTNEQELTRGEGEGGDAFGYAVSVQGETIVVGAPGRNAAYIFTRSGGIWTEQRTLTGAVTALLGHSVSLSGATVLAGAPWDTDKAPYRGSAFVFALDYSASCPG
jgi:hypothetical protein